MQAPMSAPSRLVDTASRDPFGIRLTFADQLEAPAGSAHDAPAGRELRPGSFNARRYETGGDDRGFQQAEIVAAEVKHLFEFPHLGRCFEIGRSPDG